MASASTHHANSHFQVEYLGFSGINRAAPSKGLPAPFDINNFRPFPDGSLRKRCGYEAKASFSDRIRGVFPYSDTCLLVLAGHTLYTLDPTHWAKEAQALATVGSSSGEVRFFPYGKRVLLLDGNAFYVYNGNTLSPLVGYTPLYGKLWGGGIRGPIHEPLNILSRHVRVSYQSASTDVSLIFPTPPSITSIDAVYLNGIKCDTSLCSFVNAQKASVCFAGKLTPSDELLVYYTLEDSVSVAGAADLFSCQSVTFYGNRNAPGYALAAAFYRGNDKTQVYLSRSVESSVYEADAVVYADAFPYYITEKDAYHFGSGENEITTISRKENDALVFTENEAFRLSGSGAPYKITTISRSVGCASVGCVISIGDDPISVGRSGILRWLRRSDFPEGVLASEVLSEAIAPMVSDSFPQKCRCFFFRAKNEIWFSDPDASDKTVFIYHPDRALWFRFSAIDAEDFFEMKGTAGFFKDQKIFLFDEALSDDHPSDAAVPISADFVTPPLYFDLPFSSKRLSRISLQCNAGGRFWMTVTNAQGYASRQRLCDESRESIGVIDKRVAVGRARFFTVALTSDEAGASELRSLRLIAAQ